MKKKILLTALVSASLLAACQTKDQQANLEQFDQATLSDTNNVTAYKALVSQHLGQLEEVATDFNINYDINGEVISRQQTNKERFKEGNITAYTVELTDQVDDQTSQTQYYYDGSAGEKGKGYIKVDQGGFQETDLANTAPTYLQLIQWLIAGEDQWQGVEEDDQVTVQKVITDDEILDQLRVLIDTPVLVTPSAQDQALLTYQLDQSGAIKQAHIEYVIEDQGKTYRVGLEATPTFSKLGDQPLANPDLDQNKQADIDKNQLADQFKQANPAAATRYYEMTTMNTIGSQAGEGETRVVIVNAINNQPLAELASKVENNKVGQYQLNYDGRDYALDQGQVKVTDRSTTDYYGHFVNLFMDQLASDDLVAIDGSQDGVYNYRKLYENDFVNFDKDTPGIDVKSLEKNEEAIYALDYLIDAKSGRLVGVYLWAATAGQTEINETLALTFNNFNATNINVLAPSVDDKIWQALEK
ncbi:hypothetical protein AWM75_01830 [Aerococcus urinaehominis]|uniref:Uncharacterized protein n=1 Tax=Aerococcus urinaehominis TaxID=128944 RepID=A0A0X8FK51_9LACT|nr:hypothetical protein [Aerococcus urinaehominis]AMB98808.1 hypothetical protein AWM75_01830 [Aerococcus urinaehominis]SDM49527.1 hypothetical protein SAMN04487985_11926 [Aerococcus urinaehominis]